MTTLDIKSFYTTSLQLILVGLNLVFKTILIICLVYFILIKVELPQEELPKILITQLLSKKNHPIEELPKISRTEMKAVN